MVKCESLRMNMYRITHTGKSMNFPVTQCSPEAPAAGVFAGYSRLKRPLLLLDKATEKFEFALDLEALATLLF